MILFLFLRIHLHCNFVYFHTRVHLKKIRGKVESLISFYSLSLTPVKLLEFCDEISQLNACLEMSDDCCVDTGCSVDTGGDSGTCTDTVTCADTIACVEAVNTSHDTKSSADFGAAINHNVNNGQNESFHNVPQIPIDNGDIHTFSEDSTTRSKNCRLFPFIRIVVFILVVVVLLLICKINICCSFCTQAFEYSSNYLSYFRLYFQGLNRKTFECAFECEFVSCRNHLR